MDKSKNEPGSITREGSPTAGEIYTSVGLALSWWEASEDMLEMLFQLLCGHGEPVAMETFGVAPRASRNKMILSALMRYPSRALSEEKSAIRAGIKGLDKLASMRNEIAHGHVSEVRCMIGNMATMQGNFLISSLNPWGEMRPRQLNFKYAHTAAEIDAWREKVRAERIRILDVWQAIMTRDQTPTPLENVRS